MLPHEWVPSPSPAHILQGCLCGAPSSHQRPSFGHFISASASLPFRVPLLFPGSPLSSQVLQSPDPKQQNVTSKSPYPGCVGCATASLTPTVTQREASATLHSPRNHGLVCATLFPRWHSRTSLPTLCLLCLCHHQGSGPSQSPPRARHTGTFLSSIFYQMTNALPSPAVCPSPLGHKTQRTRDPTCIA